MPLTNPPIALQLGLEALQLQVNALQTTVNGLSGFTTAIVWTNANLGGRWNNASGWAPASYAKYGQLVLLRGGLASLGNVDIFQLPTGHRPSHPRTHPVVAFGNSTFQSAAISIDTNGWVKYVYGPGQYFSLDGVCFPV